MIHFYIFPVVCAEWQLSWSVKGKIQRIIRPHSVLTAPVSGGTYPSLTSSPLTLSLLLCPLPFFIFFCLIIPFDILFSVFSCPLLFFTFFSLWITFLLTLPHPRHLLSSPHLAYPHLTSRGTRKSRALSPVTIIFPSASSTQKHTGHSTASSSTRHLPTLVLLARWLAGCSPPRR